MCGRIQIVVEISINLGLRIMSHPKSDHIVTVAQRGNRQLEFDLNVYRDLPYKKIQVLTVIPEACARCIKGTGATSPRAQRRRVISK